MIAQCKRSQIQLDEAKFGLLMKCLIMCNPQHQDFTPLMHLAEGMLVTEKFMLEEYLATALASDLGHLYSEMKT